MSNTIKIGIVDDHQLFRKSLSMMLASFKNYTVVLEASNGKELQEKIVEKAVVLPDIMLIDVTMPLMNGIATANWLQHQYPTIKLVALSMNDKDHIVINMIKAGCIAYFLKDIHPDELQKALDHIHLKGYYNGDISNINYRRLLLNQEEEKALNISSREKEFLIHACSDMTYKQIAGLMKLSERTIDGYRESLFAKLNVQSRVGLALEAIRREIVKLD